MNKQFAPAIVTELAKAFALKDSNIDGYLSGPKLISLFNGFGFADVYKFNGGGITTETENGLSRTQYAVKRLTDLNQQFKLPDAVAELLKFTNNAVSVTSVICDIERRFNVSLNILQTSVEQNNLHTPERHYVSAVRNADNVIAQRTENVETNSQDIAKIADREFDTIPPGHKVVFISYSWDSDIHKDWVRKLATDLIEKYSIYCLLDQFVDEGYPLSHFMSKGISISDRVLVIGSSAYAEKSLRRSQGGVPYEDQIISAELMTNIASTKFIPILREGKFETSFPPHLRGRKGFDLSNDADFESKVAELARQINDTPNYPRPTLGDIPNDSYGDLSNNEKESLRNPQSDFRKKQDEKWLNRLLGAFSFDFMTKFASQYPDTIDGRILISFDIWSEIIRKPTFIIYDLKLKSLISEFHSKWAEIIKKGYKYYSALPNSHDFKFMGLQGDIFISDDLEGIYNELIDLRQELFPHISKLAEYIQEKFEIDVEETSSQFLNFINNSILNESTK